MQKIPEEVWNWFCKIGLWCLLASTITVATHIKNKTGNWLTTATSVIIGVCMALICGPFIIHYMPTHISPVAIGTVTICGEKISYYLLYRFNFDVIGDAIVKYIKKKLK